MSRIRQLRLVVHASDTAGGALLRDVLGARVELIDRVEVERRAVPYLRVALEAEFLPSSSDRETGMREPNGHPRTLPIRFCCETAMMRRLPPVLLVALLVVSGIALPADAAPDPLSCAGYAERRQFVDAQAWWLNDPNRGFNGGDRGHAHMGACIPERERVSGTVPFDVRIVMHDNPGRLTYVSAVFKTRSTETTVARQYPSRHLQRRCRNLHLLVPLRPRRGRVPRLRAGRDPVPVHGAGEVAVGST